MDTDDIFQLCSLANEYDIELNTQQAALLLEHLRLVREKNKSCNLTRITTFTEGLIKHIIDSLLFTTALKITSFESSDRFIDIGTGAGYPGIPFGIVCGLHGTLIDSKKKKIAALHDIVSEMQLDSFIYCTSVRSEELARVKPNSYQFVLARAVAELASIMEYASPLVKLNGFFITSKAQLSDEEWTHGKLVEDYCGFSNVSRETFELPSNFGKREILVYKKTNEGTIALPRRDGLAVRKPLWKRNVSRETMLSAH